MTAKRISFDGVLIVGAGLAGLSAALAAAPRRALVLAAAPLGQGCASAWAQGGMAAALSDGDAPALHAADTIAAGAGLCDPDAVAVLTREGPAAVRRLAALGAPFDRDRGRRLRAEPGGRAWPRPRRPGRRRRRRRGDHAGGDRGGPRRAEHRGSRGLGAALLTDAAGRVRGALAEDRRARWWRSSPPATVLATGGLGGLYAVTTTPRDVRGEGLALAALAGAVIADPEFVQFHPTAIDLGARSRAARHRGAARRGREAGRTPTAQPFMARYHRGGRARPARRGRPRHRRRAARPGAAPSSTPARRSARRSRTSSRPCSPRRWPPASIRADQPIPVAPAVALPHGRRRDGPLRPHVAGRPLRRRRVRLDRRAWRQPAGVQLAARGGRVRRRAGARRCGGRRSRHGAAAGRRPRPSCRTPRCRRCAAR